jgi:hypothetical protein
MELGRKVVLRQLDESKNGRKSAFILALVFGSFALIATLSGHDAVGALLASKVGGLVSTFIFGRPAQAKSWQEKDPKVTTRRLGDGEL